ncbi:cyanophycinase [Parasphingopyxis lamellibrachiae]|uniref:Cyanophycinase n=1 Tax=Parasphingopyxis lamellibrachiae TaxID=680125 RepID=A0A3D9FBQ7_9SPHN|nr:cyanophycinase [Parasphingopyxis lamellibrachiae]RED15062.1 cyanophycinase [Parasphingopyxis lamellibrachiae]
MALRRLLAIVGVLLAGWLLFSGPAQAVNGRLLIVGGGLSLENDAIYRALIDHRPADAPRIAIIPAASAEPASQAAIFAGGLMFHGVEPENIAIVHLARSDDPDTPDVDETDWAAGADSAEEIAKIENAGAIWFAGGNPQRLTALLVQGRGADSPMLAAIRARLAAGAIVGGIDGAAAAMSNPMIAHGDAFNALFSEIRADSQEFANGVQPLVMPQGLRLFSPFTIDTRFGQEGRLGRLAHAIMGQPGPARIGLGIDVDTGLLVDLERASARVLGPGAVTLLDGRRASRTASISGFLVRGLRLSRLHEGDRLSLTDLEVSPDADRRPVEDRQRVYGGIWPSARSLDALESERRTLQVSERYLGGNAVIDVDVRQDHGKRNAEFTFVGRPESRYWRRAGDEGWAGTLTSISLTIDGHFSPSTSPRP